MMASNSLSWLPSSGGVFPDNAHEGDPKHNDDNDIHTTAARRPE